MFEDDKGRVWARFTYTDEITGKRHNVKRRAENRTKGRELLKELIRDLDDNGSKAIQADRLTFSEIAERYKKAKLIDAVYSGERKVAGLRSKSSATHIKPLITYFGRRGIKQILVNDIQTYKLIRLNTDSRRGDKISIATVNRELAVLRSIFNYARSEGWLNKSPFDFKGFTLISMADEVKRHRILSHAEEKQILAACKGKRTIEYERGGQSITAEIEYNFSYLKVLIITALDTAMRKGELLTLLWSDVDFQQNQITIRAVNTKIQTRRMVGMTSRVHVALQDIWRISSQDLSAQVFGITDIKKSFQTVRTEAKIKDLRFHDLRHTATTRMVATGMPAAEIMKITGHLQMTTFLRYVNQTPDITRRHANALDLYLESNQTK